MTTQAKSLGKRIKDVVLVATLVATQALATLMGGAATTAYAADGDTVMAFTCGLHPLAFLCSAQTLKIRFMQPQLIMQVLLLI